MENNFKSDDNHICASQSGIVVISSVVLEKFSLSNVHNSASKPSENSRKHDQITHVQKTDEHAQKSDEHLPKPSSSNAPEIPDNFEKGNSGRSVFQESVDNLPTTVDFSPITIQRNDIFQLLPVVNQQHAVLSNSFDNIIDNINCGTLPKFVTDDTYKKCEVCSVQTAEKFLDIEAQIEHKVVESEVFYETKETATSSNNVDLKKIESRYCGIEEFQEAIQHTPIILNATNTFENFEVVDIFQHSQQGVDALVPVQNVIVEEVIQNDAKLVHMLSTNQMTKISKI